MSEQITKKSSRMAWIGWIAGAVLAALGAAGAVWIARHGGQERGAAGGAHDHGGDAQPHAETGRPDEHAHQEHPGEVVVPPEGQKRWGIRIDIAAKKVLRPTFEVPARVSFNQEKAAHIGSPLRGRVTEIAARLGDEVKKGDVLLVVESPELGEAQADLLSKIAAAKAAAPKVAVARSLFERGRSLQQSDRIVSRSEVDRRELELREAEAIQQSAQSAVDASKQRLLLLGMSPELLAALCTDCEVRPRLSILAPVDGRVVEREVTLGELVGPDRAPLIVVADTLSVWVLADVPEGRLRDVERGARVIVRAAGSSTEGLEGAVTYISPSVHRDTRAGEVRVEVAHGGGRLMPGMFVRAEITAVGRGHLQDPVVAVPEAALQTIDGGTCLFVPVPGEEHTFKKQPVAVGRPVAGFVPVYSGLDEGHAFVASGTFIFKAELGKGSAAHEH